MAAGRIGNGACKINYFLPKQTGKKAAMPRYLESPVKSVVYGAGKRHFFNSMKLGVSYYYDVLLHTGNRFGAGTDANVFLEIYGDKGASGEVPIPSKKGELERGMINRYKVASSDLGILKKISVRHDNTGFGPAWYLEKVTVKDHTGSRYVFNCGEWLQKRSGEDKLQAELALSEQGLDQVSVFKGKSMDYLKLNEDEHLSAIEETVHENLTNVLQSIISSNSDEDSFFTQASNPMPNDIGDDIVKNEQLAPMLPAARLLVEAFGLVRGQIPATGPKGHLLKGDVLKYIEENKVPKLHLQGVKEKAPVATKMPFQPDTKNIDKTTEAKKAGKEAKLSGKGAFEDVFLNDIDRSSASVFLNAKSSIPHFYSSTTCNLNNVIATCKEWSRDGTSISSTSFVLKAVSAALRSVPQVNVQSSDGKIITPRTMDIDTTLHTSNGTQSGLVQNIDEMNLQDIEIALEGIRAKNDRDINTGLGSFTVVDLSEVGLSHYAEIIRPPQTCILTVGTPKLSLTEDGNLSNLSSVTLSCDGTLITEDVASRFLDIFKKAVENPAAYF